MDLFDTKPDEETMRRLQYELEIRNPSKELVELVGQKTEDEEMRRMVENNDKEAINEELGDLFFTFLCLTRHLDCDPEEVLELANIKFKKRFDEVKALLKKEEMTYANPEEMDRLWRIIKKEK